MSPRGDSGPVQAPIVIESGIKVFHLYVTTAGAVLVIVVTLLTSASRIISQGTEVTMTLDALKRGQEQANTAMVSLAQQVQDTREKNIEQDGRLNYLDGGGSSRRTPAFPNRYNGAGVGN